MSSSNARSPDGRTIWSPGTSEIAAAELADRITQIRGVLTVRTKGPDERVKLVQQALSALGERYRSLLEGKPAPRGGAIDGWYRGRTEEAVKAYQRAKGIEPDGRFGYRTRKALHDDLKALTQPAAATPPAREGPPREKIGPSPGSWPTLRPGMADGEGQRWVRDLQEALLSRGDSRIKEVTGTFDALTEQAVKRLQRKTGLKETGVADEATWQALLKAPAKTTPPPQPTSSTIPHPSNAGATGLQPVTPQPRLALPPKPSVELPIQTPEIGPADQQEELVILGSVKDVFDAGRRSDRAAIEDAYVEEPVLRRMQEHPLRNLLKVQVAVTVDLRSEKNRTEQLIPKQQSLLEQMMTKSLPSQTEIPAGFDELLRVRPPINVEGSVEVGVNTDQVLKYGDAKRKEAVVKATRDMNLLQQDEEALVAVMDLQVKRKHEKRLRAELQTLERARTESSGLTFLDDRIAQAQRDLDIAMGKLAEAETAAKRALGRGVRAKLVLQDELDDPEQFAAGLRASDLANYTEALIKKNEAEMRDLETKVTEAEKSGLSKILRRVFGDIVRFHAGGQATLGVLSQEFNAALSVRADVKFLEVLKDKHSAQALSALLKYQQLEAANRRLKEVYLPSQQEAARQAYGFAVRRLESAQRLVEVAQKNLEVQETLYVQRGPSDERSLALLNARKDLLIAQARSDDRTREVQLAEKDLTKTGARREPVTGVGAALTADQLARLNLAYVVDKRVDTYLGFDYFKARERATPGVAARAASVVPLYMQLQGQYFRNYFWPLGSTYGLSSGLAPVFPIDMSLWDSERAEKDALRDLTVKQARVMVQMATNEAVHHAYGGYGRLRAAMDRVDKLEEQLAKMIVPTDQNDERTHLRMAHARMEDELLEARREASLAQLAFQQSLGMSPKEAQEFFAKESSEHAEKLFASQAKDPKQIIHEMKMSGLYAPWANQQALAILEHDKAILMERMAYNRKKNWIPHVGILIFPLNGTVIPTVLPPEVVSWFGVPFYLAGTLPRAVLRGVGALIPGEQWLDRVLIIEPPRRWNSLHVQDEEKRQAATANYETVNTLLQHTQETQRTLEEQTSRAHRMVQEEIRASEREIAAQREHVEKVRAAVDRRQLPVLERNRAERALIQLEQRRAALESRLGEVEHLRVLLGLDVWDRSQLEAAQPAPPEAAPVTREVILAAFRAKAGHLVTPAANMPGLFLTVTEPGSPLAITPQAQDEAKRPDVLAKFHFKLIGDPTFWGLDARGEVAAKVQKENQLLEQQAVEQAQDEYAIRYAYYQWTELAVQVKAQLDRITSGGAQDPQQRARAQQDLEGFIAASLGNALDALAIREFIQRIGAERDQARKELEEARGELEKLLKRAIGRTPDLSLGVPQLAWNVERLDVHDPKAKALFEARRQVMQAHIDTRTLAAYLPRPEFEFSFDTLTQTYQPLIRLAVPLYQGGRTAYANKADRKVLERVNREEREQQRNLEHDLTLLVNSMGQGAAVLQKLDGELNAAVENLNARWQAYLTRPERFGHAQQLVGFSPLKEALENVHALSNHYLVAAQDYLVSKAKFTAVLRRLQVPEEAIMKIEEKTQGSARSPTEAQARTAPLGLPTTPPILLPRAFEKPLYRLEPRHLHDQQLTQRGIPPGDIRAELPTHFEETDLATGRPTGRIVEIRYDLEHDTVYFTDKRVYAHGDPGASRVVTGVYARRTLNMADNDPDVQPDAILEQDPKTGKWRVTSIFAGRNYDVVIRDPDGNEIDTLRRRGDEAFLKNQSQKVRLTVLQLKGEKLIKTDMQNRKAVWEGRFTNDGWLESFVDLRSGFRATVDHAKTVKLPPRTAVTLHDGRKIELPYGGGIVKASAVDGQGRPATVTLIHDDNFNPLVTYTEQEVPANTFLSLQPTRRVITTVTRPGEEDASAVHLGELSTGKPKSAKGGGPVQVSLGPKLEDLITSKVKGRDDLKRVDVKPTRYARERGIELS